MKVACIQMNVRYGKVEENFANAEKWLRKAAAQGAEIAVLPEMWNTGYALKDLPKLADDKGQRTQQFLSELSQQLQLHIVGGSVATAQNEHYYNTMYVYDNTGQQQSSYDKAHLFRLMDEHLYLTAGEGTPNRFDLGNIEAGAVICYDIRFPEWLRTQALLGAKVLFVSAQWPTARVDHWKVLLQARAIENQCFVIAVNRISHKVENFNGYSMVIGPWGEILWTGNDTEEMAIIDVPFEQVDEVRNRIPVYEDRRPEIYTEVVKD
ncbi:carbon-nitrogen hydrolase [Lysinibacillus alkalisoli]|uniref:Carbon-nitrogen hydrolase n=1 Tax=Lysinibacillus alkalisoli TaxID=1911548 RepID=A0A917FXK4_9BACI|nr:carbon-nitrogen family hydrolase [Lysinibacillus alkalisoli]GGG11672.1 carbon-nitrogen hydrolase [Lysinibacillus alkalisoli]